MRKCSLLTLTALMALPWLLPAAATAYQVGDTTADWTLLDAWQETSHRLYDYRGKVILVTLFRDT